MLIIDGTYLIYRSYHRTEKIKQTYGMENHEHFIKVARNMFLKILSDVKSRYQPEFLYIVFDGEGKNYRHDLLPTYKSQREEKPLEILPIKHEVYRFLEKHKFAHQVSINSEGDDLIASFVSKYPNDRIMIYTGDSDLGATVNSQTHLLLARPSDPKKKIYEINSQNFHHFFPVPPSKMADFKALQGDKSDFIKGVDGLFKTEAIHLLMEFSSVEDYFERGQNHYLYNKLLNHKEKILVNKTVCMLKRNCPIYGTKKSMDLRNINLPTRIAEKIGW